MEEEEIKIKMNDGVAVLLSFRGDFFFFFFFFFFDVWEAQPCLGDPE